MATDGRIEIVGDLTLLWGSGSKREPVKVVSTADFLTALDQHFGTGCPDGLMPFPEGVRFFRRRGERVVVVVEQAPSVRTVRWIADLDIGNLINRIGRTVRRTPDKGPDAEYINRRLAFPFVVLVLAFRNGEIDWSSCQAFYRNEPLRSEQDELWAPNLLNVTSHAGFECLLCLGQQVPIVSGLSWYQKIVGVVNHFWFSAFNRSLDIHGLSSSYSRFRERGNDVRLSSAAAWERASQRDPSFPLKVAWTSAGVTVAGAVAKSLGTSDAKLNLFNLINFLPAVEKR